MSEHLEVMRDQLAEIARLQSHISHLEAHRDSLQRELDNKDNIRGQFLDCAGHNARLRAALEELKTELINHGYAPEGFFIELIDKALA